jgi:hypothetical protein
VPDNCASVAPDLTPWNVLAALICLLLLPLSLALDDLRDLLVFLDIFAKPFLCRFSLGACPASHRASRWVR